MKMFGKYDTRKINGNGFSLIEVLILIVAIGIAAGSAVQWMSGSVDDVRKNKTEREMEMLATAITGDPEIISDGERADFGYVGDIGAFPSNLQALYQNPGGYSTWDGPYIEQGFLQDNTGFLYDEWGAAYNYGGGTTITSTGSGSTLTKKIADAPSDYLLNRFYGTILDSAGNVPGTTYLDSVNVIVTTPNGIGGTFSKSYNPDSSGIFILDSLPVGQHPLRIVYSPTVDTLYRYCNILPRNKTSRTYKFGSAYFNTGSSGTGLIFVTNSDTLWTGGCFKLKFWIENNSDAAITINTMTLIWSSPTAYYKKVTWDGTTVSNLSPSAGSGDVSVFSSPQIINPGDQIMITVEDFKPNPNGGGAPVDMTGTDFSIEFSDGSMFDFTADFCP
jgi:type II secretory pathway pseudopilin PulG